MLGWTARQTTHRMYLAEVARQDALTLMHDETPIHPSPELLAVAGGAARVADRHVPPRRQGGRSGHGSRGIGRG